jgi:hypothetical protein
MQMNAELGDQVPRYPPLKPRHPLRAAPARLDAAGISAGEGRRYKRSLGEGDPTERREPPQLLAAAMGWLGIGLGLAELIGARAVARSVGLEDRSDLCRAYGVREIVTGVGLLAAKHPVRRARWLRARLVGDVLDIATLGSALAHRNAKRGRIAGAMVAVAAVTAVDLFCAALLSER